MSLIVGVKIVFRVGLVLLKQMLGSVDKLRELQGMYETMERLRNISPDTIREEVLVQEVGLFLLAFIEHKQNLLLFLLSDTSYESLCPVVPCFVIFTSSVCLVFVSYIVQIIMLPVTEALIERECTIQVRKWRESRGELTHQPVRRLHGTRAVYDYKRRAASISSGGSFSFLGSSIPAPGPLRSSSSLLSLPGFRKSKSPFHSQTKKGSFSGPSGMEGLPRQSPPAVTSSQGRGPSHKPPIPPGAGQRAPAPHMQSPLAGAGAAAGSSRGPAPASEGNSAEGQPAASAPTQSTAPPVSTLAPSPKIVSEQITPTIPSPTANNAPLLPCPDSNKEAAPAADTAAGEEEGKKKKKKSREDKRKEREDEKKKLKEKKEKEKAEKERLRKEKERLEREKKKGGKKKDKGGGGEAEDKNGATAARDSA